MDGYWDAWASGSGQRDERRRDGAAEQGLAGLPLRDGVEGLEELYLPAGEQRDGQTIAIQQAIAGQCGELWPRGQDTGEVEGIGAG